MRLLTLCGCITLSFNPIFQFNRGETKRISLCFISFVLLECARYDEIRDVSLHAVEVENKLRLDMFDTKDGCTIWLHNAHAAGLRTNDVIRCQNGRPHLRSEDYKLLLEN